VIVAVLLLLWAVNSVAFCVAATRADAAMACCPPTDCGAMASAAPQNNCCTVQSNPSRAMVISVVLTDHVTDDAITRTPQSPEISAPAERCTAAYAPPQAPPGCNSILRI
jgi:hypothetical protein